MPWMFERKLISFDFVYKRRLKDPKPTLIANLCSSSASNIFTILKETLAYGEFGRKIIHLLILFRIWFLQTKLNFEKSKSKNSKRFQAKIQSDLQSHRSASSTESAKAISIRYP